MLIQSVLSSLSFLSFSLQGINQPLWPSEYQREKEAKGRKRARIKVQRLYAIVYIPLWGTDGMSSGKSAGGWLFGKGTR